MIVYSIGFGAISQVLTYRRFAQWAFDLFRSSVTNRSATTTLISTVKLIKDIMYRVAIRPKPTEDVNSAGTVGARFVWFDFILLRFDISFFFFILRYITVLYYLNDGYKGGETAFPLADNATLDLTVSYFRYSLHI